MYQAPPLRTLLRANAIFASTTGLIGLAATGPVAELIGVSEHRLISATGGGLLVFALALLIASGAPVPRLITAGRMISLADAFWVAGSIVILASADLPTRGNLTVAGIAMVVACFATLQLRAAGLVDTTASNQVVELSAILDGGVEEVWAIVTDHETYGRLAPNLSKVIPTAPDGPDLTRRCWDSRGRHWDEACVLWHDGERFAVEVDTSAPDYPYPLAYLRGEWAVRAVGNERAEVTIRFELRPKPGPAGAAFATAMVTGSKPLLRRILRGWQELVPTGPRSINPGHHPDRTGAEGRAMPSGTE